MEAVAFYAEPGGLHSVMDKLLATFDDFCQANDPHGEHDFGSFEAEGHTIFFKIEYYDRAMSFGSPDPSDPSVTTRVITIMLAEEY